MATSRTTTLTKAVVNNFTCIKRVVSTTAPSQQHVHILNAGTTDHPAATCPLRHTFNTIETLKNTHPEPTQFQDISTVQPYENIPGPKGLPVVGTLFEYLKKNGLKFSKMFEVYRQRALEYGPIYKEQIASISSVVISDPEEYSKVIRAEGKYPNRREMEPMAFYRQKKGITLGLVNAQGEEWHKYRSVVHKKMLKLKEVMDYCESMDHVGDDFVKHIANNKTTQHEIQGLEKELFKWAMESIGTFLFEERIGCFGSPTPERAQTFIDNLQGFFKLMQPLMYNVPIYKIYPTKLWKQYEKYTDNVLQAGRSFVEKKLQQLEGNKQTTEVSETSDDSKVPFLTYLMSQSGLSAEEALCTATDLLVGATETTSTGSLWVLYSLAKNPEIQEKLYEETQRVLPNNEPITPEKLSELTYIKAVLKETFRMYPITFATSRYLQNDLEVGGYNLPSGTHVQANLYGMYRDPALFSDPETFKPERWLRGNMSSNIKSLSNLIWGHGARMCIGRRFAEQEMHIMLTKIVQNFKLEYHHDDVEPVLNTVMTPDRPLRIAFVPRN